MKKIIRAINYANLETFGFSTFQITFTFTFLTIVFYVVSNNLNTFLK